jgi:hypothetical protein
MAEIYRQGVVVGIAIVHVTQNLGVRQLRIAGRVWIAASPEGRRCGIRLGRQNCEPDGVSLA